jgi:hypothetical protein
MPGQAPGEKGDEDGKQQHCAAENYPTCKDVNCACIVFIVGLHQGHTTGVPRGGGGRNSEVLKKLSQIPNSVEYTSVST